MVEYATGKDHIEGLSAGELIHGKKLGAGDIPRRKFCPRFRQHPFGNIGPLQVPGRFGFSQETEHIPCAAAEVEHAQIPFPRSHNAAQKLDFWSQKIVLIRTADFFQRVAHRGIIAVGEGIKFRFVHEKALGFLNVCTVDPDDKKQAAQKDIQEKMDFSQCFFMNALMNIHFKDALSGQGLCKHLLLAALLLVLTFGFTTMALDFSATHGKLTAVPIYDDCVYLLKSALLVENFRDGRFVEGMPSPIHSAFSVLLGSAAYALLGYQDYAPYAANGLIVLIYLLFLVQIWNRLPLAALVPLLIFYLCFPIVGMAVLEFRPDFAWGFFVGGMGVALVTSRSIFQSWRKALLLGVLFAASLLAKPSTFAMTGVIFLGGTAASFLIAWVGGRDSKWMLLSVRGWAISVVTAGILVLPYILYEGSHIWEYFLINSFGEHKALWKFEGDIRAQMEYYLVGMGGVTSLGSVGWVLLFWTLLGLGAVFWRGGKEDRCRAVFGVLLVFGIYLVNTVATAKSVFLGAAIYGAFLFFSAWLLAEIWKIFVPYRRGTMVAWWASALLALFLFQWPSYSRVDPGLAAHYRVMHGEAYRLIQNAVKGRSSPRILVLAPGPVIPEVLALWSARDGTPISPQNGGYILSEESLRRQLAAFDIVLSQDPGALGSNAFLPVEEFLPLATRLLDEDPAFERLGTFGCVERGQFYLFGRNDKPAGD
jgi:hypothetical protein